MVNLQTDRHAFFAGKTRSGKTTLVRSFLHAFARVVVHDRKKEWGMFAARNHFMIVETPDQLLAVLQKGAKRVIYMAADGSVEDFDEFCRTVYQFPNTGVVFDEAASYCLSGKVPYWAGELMRLGNGMGIGVISLTQRPRDVSNILLSESVIIVSFRLALKTDRDKVIQTIGTHINHITLAKWLQMTNQPIPDDKNLNKPVSIDEVLRTLPKWHYLIYDSESEEIHICAPIPLKR